MRLLLILILPFTFMTAIAQTETQIKDLISGSYNNIWSAYSTKDLDKYYTSDFKLLENGEVWNNDSIEKVLAKARESKIPIRENKFEFIEVKVTDKMAMVAYKNWATFVMDGKVIRKAYWLESATAILTDTGWRLNMIHSTRVSNEKF